MKYLSIIVITLSVMSSISAGIKSEFIFIKEKKIELKWEPLIQNGKPFNNTPSGVSVNRYRHTDRGTIYSYLKEDMVTRFALKVVPSLNEAAFTDLTTKKILHRRLGLPNITGSSSDDKVFSEWSFVSIDSRNVATVIIFFAIHDENGNVIRSTLGRGNINNFVEEE